MDQDMRLDIRESLRLSMAQIQAMRLLLKDPVFPDAVKGLPGLIRADNILQARNAVGFIIGGISEKVWDKKTTPDDLAKHKDVDVLVASDDFILSEKFEGGIDWWTPHKIPIKGETPFGGSDEETTVWSNGNGITLLFGIRRNDDFQKLSPGLYILDREQIIRMRLIEAESMPEDRMIDDYSREAHERKLRELIHTRLPDYLERDYLGRILSPRYEKDKERVAAVDIISLDEKTTEIVEDGPQRQGYVELPAPWDMERVVSKISSPNVDPREVVKTVYLLEEEAKKDEATAMRVVSALEEISRAWVSDEWMIELCTSHMCKLAQGAGQVATTAYQTMIRTMEKTQNIGLEKCLGEVFSADNANSHDAYERLTRILDAPESDSKTKGSAINGLSRGARKYKGVDEAAAYAKIVEKVGGNRDDTIIQQYGAFAFRYIAKRKNPDAGEAIREMGGCVKALIELRHDKLAVGYTSLIRTFGEMWWSPEVAEAAFIQVDELVRQYPENARVKGAALSALFTLGHRKLGDNDNAKRRFHELGGKGDFDGDLKDLDNQLVKLHFF